MPLATTLQKPKSLFDVIYNINGLNAGVNENNYYYDIINENGSIKVETPESNIIMLEIYIRLAISSV